MIGVMRNWKVDTTPFLGHNGSVEDLAWSPTEARVFASSSVDASVKLWDCRAANRAPVVSLGGHSDHVNVISWNTMIPHLVASGADDGVWKVHDLRKVRELPLFFVSRAWYIINSAPFQGWRSVIRVLFVWVPQTAHYID